MGPEPEREARKFIDMLLAAAMHTLKNADCACSSRARCARTKFTAADG